MPCWRCSSGMVGEPGVGKFCLVYEFLHFAYTRGWRVLERASVSYGKARPYCPVIGLLQRYFQIEADDEARTIRAKVTGHVLTLLPHHCVNHQLALWV